ncbi:fructose-bisphosphatase class II, partial [Enterobacter intestinihominis]
MKPELSIDFSRVTEPAAHARYNWLGRGDKKNPHGAPLHAMRNVLNQVKKFNIKTNTSPPQ